MNKDDGNMSENLQKVLYEFFGNSYLDSTDEINWFFSNYPLVLTIDELSGVEKTLNSINREFCSAIRFDPEFISSVCYNGFLPMSTEILNKYVMLIKLHQSRCVLDFNDLHISGKVKKQSSRFDFSIDTSFEKCLEHIVDQHNDNWISPPLADAFVHIHHSKKYNPEFHSFEIWENDKLIAGEIGYAVGSYYTSLSGFHNKNGAGSIQLCATAKILEKCGFSFWDLGMELKYKIDLGARNISRDNFLHLNKKNRDRKCALICDKTNAGDIIKG